MGEKRPKHPDADYNSPNECEVTMYEQRQLDLSKLTEELDGSVNRIGYESGSYKATEKDTIKYVKLMRSLTPYVAVASVDQGEFKESFVPNSEYYEAAKLAVMHSSKFDNTTRIWFATLRSIITDMAEGMPWDKIEKSYSSEQAYLQEGVCNFLLAFLRILNVVPALKDPSSILNMDESSIKLIYGKTKISDDAEDDVVGVPDERFVYLVACENRPGETHDPPELPEGGREDEDVYCELYPDDEEDCVDGRALTKEEKKKRKEKGKDKDKKPTPAPTPAPDPDKEPDKKPKPEPEEDEESDEEKEEASKKDKETYKRFNGRIAAIKAKSEGNVTQAEVQAIYDDIAEYNGIYGITLDDSNGGSFDLKDLGTVDATDVHNALMELSSREIALLEDIEIRLEADEWFLDEKDGIGYNIDSRSKATFIIWLDSDEDKESMKSDLKKYISKIDATKKFRKFTIRLAKRYGMKGRKKSFSEILTMEEFNNAKRSLRIGIDRAMKKLTKADRELLSELWLFPTNDKFSEGLYEDDDDYIISIDIDDSSDDIRDTFFDAVREYSQDKKAGDL